MLRRIGFTAGAILLGVRALTAHGQQVVPAGPPTSAGAPSPSQGRGTGLITGTVVDASGAPIAAVVVSINSGAASPRGSGPGPAPKMLTDNSGRFFFSDLAAGSYTITGTKPGLLPGAFGRRRPGGGSVPIDLPDNGRRGDITITMWPAATISGRVVDDSGDPLVDAEIRAVPQTFIAGRRLSGTPIRTKTDDRGLYRFAGLMPGNYLVVAPVVVTSEPSTFAGTIRAGGGGQAPQNYYQSMAAVGSAPMLSTSRAEGVTGDKSLITSWFALPGMPAGDAPWPIYITTFFPSTTSLTTAAPVRAVSGQDRAGTDIVVRLTQTFKVSGTVTGPDGPAAFFGVHLVPADAADAPLFDTATAVTDGTGAFTFYGVPPGSYIARVVKVPAPTGGWRMGLAGGTGAIPYIATFTSIGSGSPGPPPVPTEALLHVSQSVTVVDRHVRDLSLALRAGPRVTGHAEFDGSAARPLPQQWRAIRITLEAANGQNYNDNQSAGQFNEDGQFATPSLWPGRYLIRVTNAPPGWTFKDATYQGRDVSEAPIDISGDLGDVVITFTDHPTKVEGTVQSTDSQGVAGAAVLLFPSAPAAWVDYGRTSRRVRSVTVSSAGAFTMPAPPAGDYCLIAIPDEQAVDWQNPSTLTKLAGLAERIQVRDGAPITQSLQIKRIQ